MDSFFSFIYGRSDPVSFIPILSRQRILCRFHYLNEDEIEYKDNWINACITQGPELVLGAPNLTISFTQFSKSVSEDWGDELHSIVSIEDAMGITPKQFYDQYKSGEQKCFQVNRYLWPEP